MDGPAWAQRVHPVEKADFYLPTVATAALEQFLLDCLEKGVGGCMALGDPRHGKSWAAELLAMLFQAQHGIPMLLLLAEVFQGDVSLIEHYQALLRSVNHPLFSSGRGAELRSRFREYVVSLVSATGQNRIIIAVDDADLLSEKQFLYMQADYNWLVHNRVKPLFLMIGGRQLAHLRKSFVIAKKHYFIGRFFTLKHEIRGLRDEFDIAECLKSYDERAYYPENSGISYTEHFFPTAFKKGWRLHRLAGGFATIWEKVRTRHSIKTSSDIPMQYFISAVNLLLTRLRSDDEEPTISDADIERMIVDSGYVEAMLEDPD